MMASGNSSRTATSPAIFALRNSEPVFMKIVCGVSEALRDEKWMSFLTPAWRAARAMLRAPVTCTSLYEKFLHVGTGRDKAHTDIKSLQHRQILGSIQRQKTRSSNLYNEEVVNEFSYYT